MSGSPRILFICDAGPAVGGGHVMRSLTLARALAARGAGCAFLDSPQVAQLLESFAPDMPLSPNADGFDALVFDHYGLAAAEHRQLSNGRPCLVIDDLADRPLGADLVLDPGPLRQAADYDRLVAPGTPRLLGPRYALVRPEFRALREETLRRRRSRPPLAKVLVALGLTDVGGLTQTVVMRLLGRLPDASLEVVLGARTPSLRALVRLSNTEPRLALHIQTTDMARLAAEADIAVGAGGSSTWERSVLGLPSLLLVLAPNQRSAGEAMLATGAALVVETLDGELGPDFDQAIDALAGSADLRARLTNASAALSDGDGADRAAQALLDQLAGRFSGAVSGS